MGRPDTLRRMVLVRAGDTGDHAQGRLVGSADPPLSESGRAALREQRRHWEWTDGIVSSPLRRARETARLLGGDDARIVLLPELRARCYGAWEGLTSEEIARRDPVGFADWQAGRPVSVRRGEPHADFEARVGRAIEALLASGRVSPLVVGHVDVIRVIVAKLVGATLPDARPHPAEVVLLGRVHGGAFRLGRRSSDPEPLRSRLEREGLGDPGPDPSERHVAHLEIRGA